MKTYVITLSRTFPRSHKRAGQPTDFRNAFCSAIMCAKCKETRRGMCMGECITGYRKIHVILPLYPLWKAWFEEIEAGRACLSVRMWTGEEERSKEVELARLTADDGIGIQELKLTDLSRPTAINGRRIELPALAQNDGLCFDDWFHWFRKTDFAHPLAIIHFTRFRY